MNIFLLTNQIKFTIEAG